MNAILRQLVLAVALNGIAVSALADSIPLLHCAVKEGKELRLLSDGEELVYQYGSDIDRPELEIRRKRDEVPVRNRLLPGPVWQQQLAFRNGEYRYIVIVEAYRPVGEAPQDMAGVQAFLNEELLADKSCTPESMIQRVLDVDGIPSKPVSD
ncbi:hypothetical protein [Microbulbifer taiwanensis]|uniref:Uncharacterized protein n=1 Tax=Microbulbifer taiwanensis TaxID=986746 RepID=A0ABW1YLS2_9GAMM|nr:hypothetical protein [Microbulbifer taiwanensis]